ncbi:reverse transcriptase domain-containing protein [Tanacetum coccineum]
MSSDILGTIEMLSHMQLDDMEKAAHMLLMARETQIKVDEKNGFIMRMRNRVVKTLGDNRIGFYKEQWETEEDMVVKEGSDIPEEDVEPKQIILDPDDQPMWESAKTVAPTPNSAIIQLDVDDNFVINSTHLNMIQKNKFDGYLQADPHDHICEFLAICNMFRYGKTQSEAVKLLIFPFSLYNKAKMWFNELNEESITSWEQMRKDFINRFFPPSFFNSLLLEIRNFSQNSLKEEMHEMRKNYNKREGDHTSKNDDTPMCERQEANSIQSGVYQNQNYHDSYLHQSHHDPNDFEKSLTELNNDVRNNLEDFKRCILETFCQRRSEGDILLVQVYVNDIIFSSTSYKLCKQFEKLMTKKFEMSMMGEVTYFLGLKIKQDDKGKSICQEQYTRNLWKKYEISNSSSMKTPMVPPNNLGPDLAGKPVNKIMYRGMIRSLMYLTTTKPDIQFLTCLCARYHANPKESHLTTMKRIFRYLKATLSLGTNDEDVDEHVRRVLEIIDLFHFPGVTHDAIMLKVFPIMMVPINIHPKKDEVKDQEKKL